MNIIIIYQKKNLPVLQKAFAAIIKIQKNFSTAFVDYTESRKIQPLDKKYHLLPGYNRYKKS